MFFQMLQSYQTTIKETFINNQTFFVVVGLGIGIVILIRVAKILSKININ